MSKSVLPNWRAHRIPVEVRLELAIFKYIAKLLKSILQQLKGKRKSCWTQGLVGSCHTPWTWVDLSLGSLSSNASSLLCRTLSLCVCLHKCVCVCLHKCVRMSLRLSLHVCARHELFHIQLAFVFVGYFIYYAHACVCVCVYGCACSQLPLFKKEVLPVQPSLTINDSNVKGITPRFFISFALWVRAVYQHASVCVCVSAHFLALISHIMPTCWHHNL